MKLVATGALLAVGCEAHCHSGGYLHFSFTSTETEERRAFSCSNRTSGPPERYALQRGRGWRRAVSIKRMVDSIYYKAGILISGCVTLTRIPIRAKMSG